MTSFFVLNVKKRLELLSCPYIKDVDESWISDLLFSRSDKRLDLLEWLIKSFDSDLSKDLDCADKFNDTREKRILNVVSSLCLCSPNNTLLIEGTADESSQMFFLSTLIDLASSSRECGTENDLDRLMRDSTFLDKVVACNSVSSIYNTTLNMLPPDINKIINEPVSNKHVLKGNEIINTHLLPMQTPEIDHLKIELRELQEKIKQFKDESQFLHDLTQWDNNNLISVESLLSNLDKLLTSLNDWWLGIEISNNIPSKRKQLDIGPCFDSVSSMSREFHLLLSELISIRNIFKDLKCIVDDTVINKNEKIMKILPTFESLQKVIQQLSALGRLKSLN